tara:strand:- start:212 stop:1690 length:1479 start_codon:yes stop_codon:yes gene_type:complete
MDEESFLDRIDRLLSPETPAEMGATFAAESTPYLGTGMDIGNFLMGLRNRDAPRAGISALAALLPFVGAGTLRKVGGAVSDKLSKPKAKFLGVQPIDEIVHQRFPMTDPGRLLDESDRMRRARYYPIGGMTQVRAAIEPRELDFTTHLHPELIFDSSPLRQSLENISAPHQAVLRQLAKKRQAETAGQLDLFPEVDLWAEIADLDQPAKNRLGRSGIRSLGRAVIEDFEKAHAGTKRVAGFSGVRETGVHADDVEDYIMTLPRSFFFKKPKASRRTDAYMRRALDPPLESPQINISQRDLFLSGARQATDDELLEFSKISPIQRADPERAMLRAQRWVQGVMSPVVEHTGDLTHRLTDKFRPIFSPKSPRNSSYLTRIMHADVAPKIDHMLRRLNHAYGFEKEFAENLANNASVKGIPLDQYKKQAYAALQEYADEHKKIPVFNELQKLSRDAAIAVGERNFNKARRLLERLKEISDNEKLFLRKITEIGFD